MQLLLDILSIISPVFICAFIGYTWIKRGHDFDTPFVSKVVTNIGAPCLIFSTFMEMEIDMQTFNTMLGASFICMAIFGVIGLIVLKTFKLSLAAFLPSQMFPNCGNMGLPLCLFAFGEAGLAFGLTYFTISVVFGFTLGMAISSGVMSFRAILKNPMLYTVIVTLALTYADIEAPAWIYNTTELLGGLTIPLMLIALGVSLAKFKISSLKRSLSLSVMRLGVGFIVGVIVAEALGLEGAARGVLIMQSTMPIAVFSYLFAVRYNRSPEEVAGTVVISTALSFLTLPLLLWYVLPGA